MQIVWHKYNCEMEIHYSTDECSMVLDLGNPNIK